MMEKIQVPTGNGGTDLFQCTFGKMWAKGLKWAQHPVKGCQDGKFSFYAGEAEPAGRQQGGSGPGTGQAPWGRVAPACSWRAHISVRTSPLVSCTGKVIVSRAGAVAHRWVGPRIGSQPIRCQQAAVTAGPAPSPLLGLLPGRHDVSSSLRQTLPPWTEDLGVLSQHHGK